jgi:Family of unknown function (DUF6152)
MTVKLSRRAFAVSAAMTGLAAVLPRPASAHHSFAMFDFTVVQKARGVVEEFRWTNPHVVLVIKIDADDKAGRAGKLWSLELTSPGNLTRTGWNRKAFQPGDHVEVDFNPLRDGRQGGAFKRGQNLVSGQVWETNLRAQERPGLE